ncbi:MAG: DUF3568 domain-containing protein [Candidatus Omnitrophica bacterium]|nr:DUF3568 domain-containing protein [Candidatus Omnitrophota bacterium]
MKKKIIPFVFILFVIVNLYGCWFIVGGAVGAAGTYVMGKDSIQTETDRPYDLLWNTTLKVTRISGTITKEDSLHGLIEANIENSHVWIRLIRLTRATTRLRVSARTRMHLPNLSLAQKIFSKILEEAR